MRGSAREVPVERRLELRGQVRCRVPLNAARALFELGHALRREVLGVGLLLREVGALDPLLDLRRVREHADVDLAVERAVPKRAHLGLVALGEAPSRRRAPSAPRRPCPSAASTTHRRPRGPRRARRCRSCASASRRPRARRRVAGTPPFPAGMLPWTCDCLLGRVRQNRQSGELDRIGKRARRAEESRAAGNRSSAVKSSRRAAPEGLVRASCRAGSRTPTTSAGSRAPSGADSPRGGAPRRPCRPARCAGGCVDRARAEIASADAAAGAVASTTTSGVMPWPWIERPLGV